MGDDNNSPLWRLYKGANDLIDQPFEGKGLSLVVCSIRHYVLDATSTNILFKTGTAKNQIVPFDGYDLIVSDGKFRTMVALADIHLSNLVQKKVLAVGSVISRSTVKICYSERMSRHRFLLVTDLSLDLERTVAIKVDDKLAAWLPVFDHTHFNQPLLSLRINYTSIWNITDPIGPCWQNSSSTNAIIPRIIDSRDIPRGYTLTQMLLDQHGKNLSPLLVRVFAKSRLNYFARKSGKRLDMNVCPYQFDLLVADDRGCCIAVFWGELAVQVYLQIEVGTVLVIRGYRIKQAFKAVEYSACCFNPAIERFRFEISVNDKMLNNKSPIDIVEPSAVLPNLRLAPVPFNFIPTSTLILSPSALDETKLDFAGVVVYAGRWHREARRYFRDANENNDLTQLQDESVTEGIVVSSVSGNKYLEEFNTGGFWMWRWLILADGTCKNHDDSGWTTVRVKYYCTSQPAVQYHLQPSDPIALTQLRIMVMNKSEATNSRFQPKWTLTTTNESQLAVLTKLPHGSPFLQQERVVGVREFANKLKFAFAFGGCYDYPSYPTTFDELVKRFQSPANKPVAEQASPEVVGPLYVAAPQLEALVDGLGFFEHRCLLVHALLASVRFIPFDDVVNQASSNVGDNVMVKKTNLSSPTGRKRKDVDEDSSSTTYPHLTLATAWEERKVGFRGLGVDLPHWRTLTWHWQPKSSEIVLTKCVNLPSDMNDSTDGSSNSRLHLNPVTNFFGFLNVQLLLLNQSVYINCLVPVPENRCTDEALSQFLTSNLPATRMIDFVNACCDGYNIFAEKMSSMTVTRKQADVPAKTMRQFFNKVSSSSSSSPFSGRHVAASVPTKTSAVLTCYGLGADGVEISLKHLYPLP